MKNNKTRYCCLAFLLTTHLMYAQSVFREGYVIDLKNDTLVGELDYRGDIAMGEKCVFKLKGSATVVEYKPTDIQGYRFKDDRYFVAKEIEGEKVFLEFLIKGKISIYYLRNLLEERYFIEKEGEKLTELPYKEGIVYGSPKDPYATYLSQSNTHKNILKQYMKDAPKFQSSIDKLQKPQHDDLIKLAKNYHNAVCKDESCIVYKKKTPRINLTVEAVVGVLKYSKSENIEQKDYLNLGVLAHFWLPRVNEKLYLRTGFIYSQVKIPTITNIPSGEANLTNLFKIPVQIEYIYPKGNIRPAFAYGVNIYQPLGLSVGFMGGINVKLSEKMALSFNYDIDFIPYENITFIPTTFFSHDALIGLKVRL
jgi:hypothetical protein